MAPRACGEPSLTGITGVPATIINYHPVSPQKSRHHCAALCLGESPTQARLKCPDLHCSFEALVKAEYGGCDHLDFAARNYVENMRKEETGICGITYERAPRNLVVAMYGHYVDLFQCHSSTCVQLPGSGRQAGSLPLGCPEVTTWGGVARLVPHPRDSGWG